MLEAREFVKNNQNILKNMPVAYFITLLFALGAGNLTQQD